MVFGFVEIIHLAILTIAIGYIFSGYITDPSNRFKTLKKFHWKDCEPLFANQPLKTRLCPYLLARLSKTKGYNLC